jgi:hypothetical protein
VAAQGVVRQVQPVDLVVMVVEAEAQTIVPLTMWLEHPILAVVVVGHILHHLEILEVLE